MIYTTLDNFYLTEEQLREDSPSRRDGIDQDTETTLRIYGCEIIQEAGILLAWPQAVMATGQVLFHRFYCKRSMKDFNVKVRRLSRPSPSLAVRFRAQELSTNTANTLSPPHHKTHNPQKMAATALWLGAKLEEVPEVSDRDQRLLLRKVLMTVDRITGRREGAPDALLDPHSKVGCTNGRVCVLRLVLLLMRGVGAWTPASFPSSHKNKNNNKQNRTLRRSARRRCGTSARRCAASASSRPSSTHTS